jgi:hypothetical protein
MAWFQSGLNSFGRFNLLSVFAEKLTQHSSLEIAYFASFVVVRMELSLPLKPWIFVSVR